MQNVISIFEDKFLAEMISKGLRTTLEERLNALNKFPNRKHYIVVTITKENDEYLKELEDGYDPEDGVRYGVCRMGCNEVELVASCISFKTLLKAAYIPIKGYKMASLKNNDSDNVCIIYYKDIKDIDFSDYVMDGYRVSSADDDFLEKFRKRNFDCVIKRYKELQKSIASEENQLAESKKELEDFKKSLTSEELLAVEALGG